MWINQICHWSIDPLNPVFQLWGILAQSIWINQTCFWVTVTSIAWGLVNKLGINCRGGGVQEQEQGAGGGGSGGSGPWKQQICVLFQSYLPFWELQTRLTMSITEYKHIFSPERVKSILWPGLSEILPKCAKRKWDSRQWRMTEWQKGDSAANGFQ